MLLPPDPCACHYFWGYRTREFRRSIVDVRGFWAGQAWDQSSPLRLPSAATSPASGGGKRCSSSAQRGRCPKGGGGKATAESRVPPSAAFGMHLPRERGRELSDGGASYEGRLAVALAYFAIGEAIAF